MTTPLTEADLAAIEARLFMDYPDHERWRDAFAQVKVDAEALVADVRRLRAALAFYADKKNWRFYQTSDVPPSMKVTKSAVEIDHGDTARRALAGEGAE